MNTQPIPSVYSIITNITAVKPTIAEKITFLSQSYAQIKLGNGRLVTLRKEDYRGVPNALILRDSKTHKIIAKGLVKITKELGK